MRAISPTSFRLKENALHGNNDSHRNVRSSNPTKREKPAHPSHCHDPNSSYPIFTMGQVTNSKGVYCAADFNAQATGESGQQNQDFQNIMSFRAEKRLPLWGDPLRFHCQKLGPKHTVTTCLFDSSLGFSTSRHYWHWGLHHSLS